jgi:hypothetical protein
MYEVDEPTSRIERDELLGLLNTTTPVDHQRITARMPVVTLQGLLEAEAEEEAAPLPPPPVIVRFNAPLAPPPVVVQPFVTEDGWVMIATSFAATITFGIAAMVTLW